MKCSVFYSNFLIVYNQFKYVHEMCIVLEVNRHRDYLNDFLDKEAHIFTFILSNGQITSTFVGRSKNVRHEKTIIKI